MQSSPFVTSNAVILQYSGQKLYITLSSVTDTSNTKGRWQLPTANVAHTQTSLAALELTLRATIGLQDSDISYREQLYTSEYPSPARATVCISYLYLSRGARWFKGTQQIGVFPVDKLPPLSSNDQSTIRYALDRLHAKTLYSSIVSFLLPKVFDLAELQQVFETITHQKVDRRNFRKKFAQLAVLSAATPQKGQNPTKYQFNHAALTIYSRPFLDGQKPS